MVPPVETMKTLSPLAFVLALVFLAGVPAAPHARVTSFGPGDLLALGDGIDLSQEPDADATEGRAAVAWTGWRDGRQQVFAAFWTRGLWAPAVALDPMAGGVAAEPVVRFDPDARPAVAWTRVADGASEVVLWRPGQGTETIARSAARMEAPALAFSADGTPAIAWSQGGAGRFEVHVAQQGVGGWSTARAGGGGNRTPVRGRWLAGGEPGGPYDILPTFVGNGPMTLYWYRLVGEEFRLASAVVDVDGPRPRFSRFGFSDDVAAPANRLPVLYDTHSAPVPGAVWVEPLPSGEVVLTFDPRRAARLEDPVQALPVFEPGARQIEPDAARGSGAVAWREERREGSDVVVQSGPALARISGVPHLAQPAIAVDGDGGLHVFLVSDQVDGGDGRLYWLRIE